VWYLKRLQRYMGNPLALDNPQQELEGLVYCAMCDLMLILRIPSHPIHSISLGCPVSEMWLAW